MIMDVKRWKERERFVVDFDFDRYLGMGYSGHSALVWLEL